MRIVVSVSELAFSGSPEDMLVTYSLGSCIGLTLYDPVAGVGGLLHAMMPVSTLDPIRGERQPAMFVDTGVASLLQSLFEMGAQRRSLVATVAGGACAMDGNHTFRIGERNFTVLRRMLWKNDILIAA